MERDFRRLTWLSALGTAQHGIPDWQIGARRPIGVATARETKVSDPSAPLRQAVRVVRKNIAKADDQVGPEECQRAFDKARKLDPDALYEIGRASCRERV